MLTNIDIRKIIPHRYPFLLVDKVIEIDPGKKAVGIKNVTANEPFSRDISRNIRSCPAY